MRKAIAVVMLFALAGCAGTTPYEPGAHPCARSEASMECQIKRYHDVNI